MNSEDAGRLATVINAIGTDGIGAAIDAALASVVDFDMSCTYLFRFNQPALLLHDGYRQRVTERTLKAYLRGGYLLDPFYVACTNNHPAGLWRMSELAPDSFFASGFSISRDIHPCVSSHHGSLIEEVGFIVPTGSRSALVHSVMRGLDHGAFQPAELERLAALAPIIESVFGQHLRLRHADALLEQQSVEGELEDAFVEILQGQLTETQRHVAKLILQGHSSQSIASTLGISEGTVKVHRHNICQRLGIASNAELLRLFINYLVKQG
ncbi:putative HTH-type transcriptional regulator in exeN 3'region [Pseudomonas reidholzensis]|uniref:Putative HTH-type transcriptional regulator in exeN 3'region n=1 Tax=Pseudomonas reidholzensis TaxID=1785162 RepID=A0A383RXM8_9PSED|nr:LuxR C-terminal-related transcriptional regulator [Pseudomonas reidholzensis]SYX91513.1 putative HTH-type transcriptional regulator in exeN 3'region [Pseudomonas reidholzensis]